MRSVTRPAPQKGMSTCMAGSQALATEGAGAVEVGSAVSRSVPCGAESHHRRVLSVAGHNEPCYNCPLHARLLSRRVACRLQHSLMRPLQRDGAAWVTPLGVPRA